MHWRKKTFFTKSLGGWFALYSHLQFVQSFSQLQTRPPFDWCSKKGFREGMGGAVPPVVRASYCAKPARNRRRFMVSTHQFLAQGWHDEIVSPINVWLLRKTLYVMQNIVCCKYMFDVHIFQSIPDQLQTYKYMYIYWLIGWIIQPPCTNATLRTNESNYISCGILTHKLKYLLIYI